MELAMTPVRFPLNSGDHKGACPLVQSFSKEKAGQWPAFSLMTKQ